MALRKRAVVVRSGTDGTNSNENGQPAGAAMNPQALSTLAPFLPDNTFDDPAQAASPVPPDSSTAISNNDLLDTGAFSTPTPTAVSTIPAPSSSSSGLSTAAKAGIIGGSSAVFLAFMLTLLLLYSRRRSRSQLAARVQRQREKMDRPFDTAADLHAAATLSQPTFSHRRTQSYAPSLPPKDNELSVSIKDLGAEDGLNPPSPQEGNWRWRRGRERSDTDNATANHQEETAHSRSKSSLAPPAPRHNRTQSTGIDLVAFGPGPTLNQVIAEQLQNDASAREEVEDADTMGQGFELRRVRSDSDPNLPKTPNTQRSSRTVVLPAVPFAPTWREGADSARTSVRSWGSWAWPAGRDAREGKALGGSSLGDRNREEHSKV